MNSQPQSVRIAGRTIKVTNLDRVMYPDDGVTKAEVLQYYQTVAEPLGRQVHDRLLTRKRWPHGVASESFFEKNAPAAAPDWIDTVTAGSEPVRYPVLREEVPSAALAWFAQLGVLELHVPQWRVGARGKPAPPDRIVFDLDPGPPAALAECAQVALAIRDILGDLGLSCRPVLSGSKGMQLYLPLPQQNAAARFGMTPDQTSEFARSVAVALEEAMPKLVLSQMTKALRTGKVFLDWSQNNGAKTTIAPYSLRGTPAAHVAAPVTWAEVEAGGLVQLGPAAVVARLAETGDPFAGDP